MRLSPCQESRLILVNEPMSHRLLPCTAHCGRIIPRHRHCRSMLPRRLHRPHKPRFIRVLAQGDGATTWNSTIRPILAILSHLRGLLSIILKHMRWRKYRNLLRRLKVTLPRDQIHERMLCGQAACVVWIRLREMVMNYRTGTMSFWV
jgi:hypothetical protein